MKFCIIGGAGFVGSALAEYFCKNNKVTIIDNLSRKLSELNINRLPKKINFIKLDISKNKKKLEKILSEFDVIINCAAQVAVTTSIDDPQLDFDTNVIGSFNILEAARKSKKNPILFFSSTNKVYGSLDNEKYIEKQSRYELKSKINGINENQILDFCTPYGCSKGSMDQYFLDYSKSFGLRTIVFRKSCIYGTNQYGVEDQGWISWFAIAHLIKNKTINVYGNGKQLRDILFIDDLILAYELCIKKIDKTSGKVFNIGGGKQNTISVIEAIDKINRFSNKKINFNYSEERIGDQKAYVSDISKINKLTGWKPKVNIENGFKKMVDWIKKNNKVLEKL